MKLVISGQLLVISLVRVFCFCLLFTIHYSLNTSAFAQQGMNPDRDQPLEITAEQTLEWHRDNQQYIARGSVIAKQGDVTIIADILTADYRETSASAFEIYRLSADGNVKISSKGNVAYGQKAVYDVDRGVAVMTGDNLRLAAPDQSVTARDSFEYWVTEGRLTARGGAHVTRMGGDTLDADIVAAIFTEDATGTRQLKNLTADGHVRITTPNEIVTGKKGRYEAVTNIAVLSGDVKITRGPNVLEGERAEVNLTTNVSKMLGGPVQGTNGTGRVRGVFYPGSDKKPVIEKVPAPSQSQKKFQNRPMLLGQ